jgi:hypothetical protein
MVEINAEMLNGKAFARSPSKVAKEFGTTTVTADAVPTAKQETRKRTRTPGSALFFMVTPSDTEIR